MHLEVRMLQRFLLIMPHRSEKQSVSRTWVCLAAGAMDSSYSHGTCYQLYMRKALRTRKEEEVADENSDSDLSSTHEGHSDTAEQESCTRAERQEDQQEWCTCRQVTTPNSGMS